MQKYKIRITEILEKEYEIIANNGIEAKSIVEQNYKNSATGYVLNADNWQLTEISVIPQNIV